MSIVLTIPDVVRCDLGGQKEKARIEQALT
jgi:hypothetical protein